MHIDALRSEMHPSLKKLFKYPWLCYVLCEFFPCSFRNSGDLS